MSIFDSIPIKIPYFPGQAIICGIVFFIRGGGVFNMPIIGPILGLIRSYIVSIIAFFVVANIVINFLEDRIKKWIDDMDEPWSTILGGLFGLFTLSIGGFIRGAEELAERAVLNGWWDSGPLNINGTCKGNYMDKDYSTDFTLWKNELWKDVRSDDSTYGTDKGLGHGPGKLDDSAEGICKDASDCRDTAGYLPSIGIGNAPRKYKDCCDMNVDFCRGKTVLDNPRMPLVPHLKCGAEKGLGLIGGAIGQAACDALHLAYWAEQKFCDNHHRCMPCPTCLLDKPTCAVKGLAEAAKHEAKRLFDICVNECIANTGCDDKLRKRAENAIIKKKGEDREHIKFDGCENGDEEECHGKFRPATMTDGVHSIKQILNKYIFSKWWFWTIGITVIVYFILYIFCMLTVTGYEYRKLVEGGEMMEGAVSSIMGKGKKLTDALNLGSGSSSIMGKGKKLTDALNLGSDAAKSPLRLEISSTPGLPLQIAKFDPTTNPIPIVDALPVAKASLIPQVMGEALQSMKTSASTHPVGNYEKPFGPKIQSSKTGTSGKNVKSGKKSFLRKLKDKPWSPKPRPQAPSMTGSR